MTSLSTNFMLRGVSQAATRIGMGGAPTGGHGWGTRDDAAALAALVRAIECGITFFDTADVYGLGNAEELLRQALDEVPGSRSEVVVATKGGVAWDDAGRTRRDSSPHYLRQALEASLVRLGADCVDLYYLHWPDDVIPLEASLEELMRFRTEGKVRAIGVCNLGPTQLALCGHAGLAAVQVKGNLLEPEELLGVSAAARGIGAQVICSSALADGLLTGSIGRDRVFGPDDHRSRYPLFQPGTFEVALDRIERARDVAQRAGMSLSQLAMRWLLDCEAADAVLFGTTSPMHVAENAGCLGHRLNVDMVRSLAENVPISPIAALPWGGSAEFPPRTAPSA
jgi:aryl-alcohol dehydrogenase-like predicted oxidoreductase